MKGKILFLAAAALLAPGLRADHADFVTISATASKTYTQRKLVNGSPKPESYVFYQGKFFGGITRDPSVDRTAFLSIAKTLAPELAKQNYLPVSKGPPTNSDLLIVVNWGTTVIDPTQDKNDMEKQDQLASLLSSVRSGSGDINANVAIATANQISLVSDMNYTSHLLGYDAALQKEGHMAWASPSGMSAVQESHLAELIDERYFVILLAYDYQKILQENRDYQALRTTRPRDAQRVGPPPQPKPVWVVRMNMRAAGNNFTEALPAMSQAAANYFGKQMDDLVTAPASVGSTAHVEVGESKVLNVVK